MAVVTGQVVAEGAAGQGAGDVLQPAVVCHQGHDGQVLNIAQLCLDDHQSVTFTITSQLSVTFTITDQPCMTFTITECDYTI